MRLAMRSFEGAAPGDELRGRVLRSGGVALAAIVLLAAALRFATLGVQSFSDDELFTVWLTKMSLGHMVSTVPQAETTPHLFYVLEWVCARLFGTGEVGMRILPAVAGTLTVPVVYAAGVLGVSRRVGLAAAAFVAINPFLIWYSQEARAYALLILFVALSLMWLLAFARGGGGRALAGWALASAAALVTHYFAVFLILPEAIWLLLGRQDLRRRFIAIAIPTLAGLALLPLALHQRSAVGDPGGIGSRPLLNRLAAVPKNFLVGFSIPSEAVVTVVAGVLAAVALVLAVRGSRTGERRGIALAAIFAICGVGLPVVMAPFGFDYLSSRNVIAVLVPVALVLGYGFAVGRAGPLALVVLGAVSIATVTGVAADPRYQRPNWRGAAHALGPASTNRVLVFNPPFSNPGPFRVYFGATSRLLRQNAPRVREVAVVALEQSKPFGPHTPTPPTGPAPRPPAGFHISEDLTTSSYRLVRFTSSRPIPVSLRVLASIAFPAVPAVFVWQTPRASTR